MEVYAPAKSILTSRNISRRLVLKSIIQRTHPHGSVPDTKDILESTLPATPTPII
jgi:hypothetical protein